MLKFRRAFRQQLPRWRLRCCARETPGPPGSRDRPRNPRQNRNYHSASAVSFRVSTLHRRLAGLTHHPCAAAAKPPTKSPPFLVTHVPPLANAITKAIALLGCHAMPAIVPPPVPPTVVMTVWPEPAKQDAAQHEQSHRLPESECGAREQAGNERVPQEHDHKAHGSHERRNQHDRRGP